MAYAKSIAVTLVAAQAGTANSPNFVLCVRETIPELKTVANGGFMQDANGYDRAWFADPSLTIPLDWEAEAFAYDPTTGRIVDHVRLPNLSVAANGKIYLGFNDSGVTADQSTGTSAWSSAFGEVHHFGNRTGGLANPSDRTKDSTINGNTLSNGPTFSTGVAGQIGAGIDVTNTTQILGSSPTASNSPSAAMSVECWAYMLADYSNFRVMLCKGSSSGANPRNYTLYTNITDGKISVDATIGGTLRQLHGGTAMPAATWTHVAATYDGSALRLYVNGVLDGSLTGLSGTLDTTAFNVIFGCLDFGFAANYPWLGYLDEPRIQNVARPQSWWTAQYNNQKSSQTLYTVGPATGGGAGGFAQRMTVRLI
jgi:hypothetical protein